MSTYHVKFYQLGRDIEFLTSDKVVRKLILNYVFFKSDSSKSPSPVQIKVYIWLMASTLMGCMQILNIQSSFLDVLYESRNPPQAMRNEIYIFRNVLIICNTCNIISLYWLQSPFSFFNILIIIIYWSDERRAHKTRLKCYY